jgi:hypothetical protein
MSTARYSALTEEFSLNQSGAVLVFQEIKVKVHSRVAQTHRIHVKLANELAGD